MVFRSTSIFSCLDVVFHPIFYFDRIALSAGMCVWNYHKTASQESITLRADVG